MVITATRTEDL